MIEGQMTALPAAVSAFEFIPNKHIPFAEWHPGPINHTNEFYQLDNSRNFYGKPFSGSDGVPGIAQDLNLFLEEQAHGPFPINNIQKGVIRIKHHTLSHFCSFDERGRLKTVRQTIVALLQENEMTANDLSRAAGVPEKEVCDHLTHIRLSMKAGKSVFSMTPPECRSCGYVYTDRRRLTRPGRCPRCKATHLSPPSFRIDG